MTTVHDKILARIRTRGRGKVYISKDFLDLGTRMCVDQTLSRLVKAGQLRRLGRGLYHYPKINARVGLDVPADDSQILAAVSRQTGQMVAPSGAVVANQLGLSTQVPAKRAYVTSGRTRRVKIGNQVVVIQHVARKVLPSHVDAASRVLQVVHYLGPNGLTSDATRQLQSQLTDDDRQRLLKHARYASDWVADTARQVAGELDGVATHHG